MKTKLFKSLTYRAIATLELLAIAYFVSGDISAAFHIGGFTALSSFGVYYAFEHAWAFFME